MRPGLTILLFLAAGLIPAVAAEPIGPEKGALVIVGGGRLTPEIVKEFLERGGGIDGAFVIIPTAAEGEDWGEKYVARSFLTRAGAKDVTVLHTRDPKVADTDEFVAPLRRATGVWIDGGRQWRLADSFLGTKTERELHSVLARGGVIGGSSAGATIQGSYLVRGAPEGNQIMMAKGHEQGFGFLRNAAIDQHINARKREADLGPVIEAYPDLLGIGLDEATAIVVTGDRFRVIGAGRTLIHHKVTLANDGPKYETLASGDEYDLAMRKKSVAEGK